MIFYKTESSWYKFVLRFFTLSSFLRALRTGVFFGVYTYLVRLAFNYYEIEFTTTYKVFEILGGIFTLLMVFRTTQSYNRWWEARKTWGALVNNCRNLAVYINNILDKSLKKEKDSLALHIANFTHALAYHLRDDAETPDYYEISEELEEELKNGASHPIVFSDNILRELKELYKEKQFDGFEFDMMKSQHATLIDILGINERIKKAPIPFSYVAFLKVVIFSFGFLMAFQHFENVTEFIVPFWVGTIMTILSLLEIIGAEIEDPFETRENDLPLVQMANVITRDVFKILGQQNHHPRSTEMKEFHHVI